MAKKYINKAEGTDPIVKSRNILIAAPYDVRSVVETYDDLFNKATFVFNELYVGMLVITYDTQDVYVLSKLPGSRDNAIKWAENIKWKKINLSEINPANYLSYYQQKLGARVVGSFDELLSPSLESPFAGMFGVVKVSAESGSESEDESGLYVLTREPNTTASNWYRILGGSGGGNAGSGLDVTEVITSDGSVPAAGTGFSIAANASDALIVETYVDNGLEAGKYYTSRGLSSSDKNGGNVLNTEYIKLTNGGGSYIQLNSSKDKNWIELNIVDDTLGFGMEDVTWIDTKGVEHQMTESPLVLPKETPISFGNKNVNFNGMTETRSNGNDIYTFGSSGSTYSDVDIYTTDILPTVYAYADGKPVRVLTEGDKDELINMISEATDFTPITDTQIRNLF